VTKYVESQKIREHIREADDEEEDPIYKAAQKCEGYCDAD
jgi:hypothetical protein